MVILIAWLIPFAIALSLLVGIYAAQSKTVLKTLRAADVSTFDIICSALLLYAVVRILVVARIKWRQESAISPALPVTRPQLERQFLADERNKAWPP